MFSLISHGLVIGTGLFSVSKAFWMISGIALMGLRYTSVVLSASVLNSPAVTHLRKIPYYANFGAPYKTKRVMKMR